MQEVTHNWQFRSARGTWFLKETDLLATEVHATVKQVLVVPGDSTIGVNGKYILSWYETTRWLLWR